MSKTSIQRIISLGVFVLILSCFNCGSQQAEGKTESERAIPVKVQTVTTGSIKNTLEYMGNIEAINKVMVFAPIPNRITTLKVDVNDHVEQGDLLAVIENKKIKQGLLQAEAALESAKARYENTVTEWERIQKLYEENAVSKSQYDAVKTQKQGAESALKQAQAGLQTAREQYQDTFIKAPISGIIASRNYDVGDQTSPQRPVFNLINMDTVKVIIDIVEKHVGIVKAGQACLIQVESYPKETFKGHLAKIYPTLNPMTRTIRSEVYIANTQNLKLKPGMYATVNIVTEQRSDVITIPKHAVIERTRMEYLQGEISNTQLKIDQYVFIVQNRYAQQRKIEPGITTVDRIEVLSGLKTGEKLITVGQYDVSDSSQVKIVEEG